MSYFLSHRRLIIGCLLLFLLLAIMFVTAGERVEVTRAERIFRDVIAPAEKVLNRTAVKIRGVWRSVAELKDIRKENIKLRKKIDVLTAERDRLLEDRFENRRLRKLLNFTQKIPHDVMVAEVIARDPSNWLSTIVIDKGSQDGIKKNMPVLTDRGLVGRVMSVSQSSSTVLLIVDPRALASVGGLITRSRDLVVVDGMSDGSGLCEVRPLVPTSDIRKGDRVVTSGLGVPGFKSNFPKGITIGRILRVDKGKYGVAKRAYLKPATDFGKLEEVLVLKKVVSMPAGEENDAR